MTEAMADTAPAANDNNNVDANKSKEEDVKNNGVEEEMADNSENKDVKQIDEDNKNRADEKNEENAENKENVENNEAKDQKLENVDEMKSDEHNLENEEKSEKEEDEKMNKSENIETRTDELQVQNTDSIMTKENIDEMGVDELKVKLNEYRLKCNTLQNELDTSHDKNTELQRKFNKLSESRKKSEESMSGTEAREKAKQHDGLAFHADYLARELSQQQNTEAFLREKLTETLEEKEELERKNKDLQLRLKRFTKDDQAKDERIARMEQELQDINTQVQEMEKLVDQSSLLKIHEMRQRRRSSVPNGDTLPQPSTQTSVNRQQTSATTSKTCIIL